MARLRRVRGNETDSGASAVEFALILPVLALLVFGIIGFGIVFAQQLALGNASRQAARYGAVAGPTCAQIVTQVTGALTNTLAMNVSSVTVTISRGTSSAAPSACVGTPSTDTTTQPCQNSTTGDNVYVRTNYTTTMIVPFVQPSLNLSATGAFKCEFQ